MPLDNVARRYADALFSAEREKLTREQAERLTGGGPQQTHAFLTRFESTGVAFMEALADARADSLLAAYDRAGVSIDGRAVEEIFADVSQLCEAQGGSLTQGIRDIALRTNMGNEVVTSLLGDIAREATRVAGGVRLKLTAKRDEAILDARSALTRGTLTNPEIRQLDQLLQLMAKGEFEKDLAAFAPQANVDSPLSLLFMDLDHFKSVNDSYGHAVGDDVLVAAASTLKAACQGKGQCYRWGGEELAVLLPNHTCDEAIVLSERIRKAIAGLKFKGYPSQITVSIGVTSYPGMSASEGDLLKDADAAMYRAKNEGRNRVCFADGFAKTLSPQTPRLSNAEISKRLEKVRLWVKLNRGRADNFILDVENKSDEQLEVEEIRVESDGYAITEPVFPPLPNLWALWPRCQRPIGWTCQTDPSATLIRMNDHKGLPFKAELKIVLVCSLSEQSREFDQKIPVNVMDRQIVSLL